MNPGGRSQLAFPWMADAARDPRYVESELAVGASNTDAVTRIGAWPDWPGRMLLLLGPQGAGKTHLAHIWAARSGGGVIDGRHLTTQLIARLPGPVTIAVDDAGAFPEEEALFHLYNAVQHSGGSLLLTAALGPDRWPVRLPDLKSRLDAIAVVRIAQPDLTLAEAIVARLFRLRQIRAAPEVVTLVAREAPRTYAGIRAVVDQIDEATLAVPGGLTRGRVRQIMREIKADGDEDASL